MNSVAFLGTGLLGSAMVEAMLRRGLSVTVWNRTEAKTDPLAALGARVAPSAAEAVASADEVHIALSDDAVVDGVVAAIAAHLSHDAIVIDHSTTLPAGTKARLDRAESQGMKFLHAPVFMSPQMCRDAVGLMLVAGRSAVFTAVKDRLAPMTGEVWYVGERQDLAAAYKLFGNAMLLTITGGFADIFAIARSLGVPPADVAGLFTKWKAGSVIPQRADKIARGDFTATFELTMARKDIRLMLEAAGHEPLAVLPAIAIRMDEMIAEGRGADDSTAIAAPNASSHTARR